MVEITAAMEELAQTATQIAGNAEAQAELARLGEATGNEGAAAVDRAVAGVERLRERIAAIAKRAADLERRAEEIFGVLALVEDIARETHLLSLNAAIEAAGEAGDVGRRFGEVAEEVRRLSGRSRDAAASVRRLLEEFSTSIAATVEATSAGGREAERVLAAGDRHRRQRSPACATRSSRPLPPRARSRPARRSSAPPRSQVVQTLREASAVVQQIADGLRGFSGAARDLEEAAVERAAARAGLPARFAELAPASRRELGGGAEAAARQPRRPRTPARSRCSRSGPTSSASSSTTAAGSARRSSASASLVRAVAIPDEIRFGHDFSDRPWFRAAAERAARHRDVRHDLDPDQREGRDRGRAVL